MRFGEAKFLLLQCGQCDFQKFEINVVELFGAFLYSMARFGAVLRDQESYRVFRCCDKFHSQCGSSVGFLRFFCAISVFVTVRGQFPQGSPFKPVFCLRFTA